MRTHARVMTHTTVDSFQAKTDTCQEWSRGSLTSREVNKAPMTSPLQLSTHAASLWATEYGGIYTPYIQYKRYLENWVKPSCSTL